MSTYWGKKQKELHRAWGIFYSNLRKRGLNPAKEMQDVGQRKFLYPYKPKDKIGKVNLPGKIHKSAKDGNNETK